MKDTQGVQIQGVHFAQVELHEIEERTDLMQFREGLQDHHVTELVDVLKQGRELDPVTLWEEPETGATVLVDGHHRLAAYRRAEWPKPIPSQVHHCDRKAARLLAMGENGKARLQFTKTERQNAAWALVCDGSSDQWLYSQKEIHEATGASVRNIVTMRNTRKEIEEQGGDFDPSWHRTLKFKRDAVPSDDDRDAWVQANTAKLNDKVGSYLGFYARNHPDAVVNVVLNRCHHECRRQLYEELMGEFEPDRLEASEDY
jgi:hypothetical protein